MTQVPSAKPRSCAKPASAHGLSIKHANAAGIDVGSKSHFVAIGARRAGPKPHDNVREFGCCTQALLELCAWLKDCGIDTVALESTGVYWVALYELLQAHGFDVWLVDAKSVRHVKARKSDVLDCQWLQQLHSFGLLTKAHRPDAPVCALRELVRLREVTLEERARHAQRMQKALSQMNLQLQSVLSDVCGATGLQIIRAIVGGQHEAQELAKLRNYRVKASAHQLSQALTGSYSPTHLYSLAHELRAYDFCSAQVAALDQEIAQALQAFAQHNKALVAHANKGRRKNTPGFEARAMLLAAWGVDLTLVPGIDAGTALKIFAELGPHLGRFASAKQFCSWLGLSPGTCISGGKRLSGRTKRIPNRVARALKMSAMGLSRSKCAMGEFYRRASLRMGSAKAIVATAHKLARIVYAMLSGQQEFAKEQLQRHSQRLEMRRLRALQQRAAELGMELVARAVRTPQTTTPIPAAPV